MRPRWGEAWPLTAPGVPLPSPSSVSPQNQMVGSSGNFQSRAQTTQPTSPGVSSPGQQGACVGLEGRVLWAFETENLWWTQGEPELLPGGITARCPHPRRDNLVVTGSESPTSEQALPEPGRKVVRPPRPQWAHEARRGAPLWTSVQTHCCV